MKSIKVLGKIFYWLVVLVVIFFGVSLIFSNTKTKGGYQLFVVQSGSMEPTIKTGSMVLVIPQKEYKKDDIVTFWENPNAKKFTSTVTHRIVSINKEEDKLLIQTKGDANPAPDREPVMPESVLGKVYFSVPMLGRILSFIKTQNGFFIFIVIPAVLIVYGEVMNIKNEVKKMLETRAKKKMEEQTKKEVAIESIDSEESIKPKKTKLKRKQKISSIQKTKKKKK